MDKRIIKFTSPYVKGDKGGYYWPEYNENDQLVWHASEADMPIIAPFDVKGEDGGYYTPNIDEAGELNWVPSNNKMPAVEGASLATKNYVNEAISAIPQPDLSDYALKTDIPDVSNFATKAEIPSLEGYALKTDIPDTSGLATKAEIPDVSGFTTMSAVEAKGYQTEAQVNSLINTALGVIENGTY